MSYLTKEQVDFFHANGYLVIENFWSLETVNTLMSTITDIINNNINDDNNNKSIFSTKEQIRKADNYFLTSGDKIRFFYEERAYNDNKLIDKNISIHNTINKIGHNLHDLNSEFNKVSYEGRVGSMCSELGLIKPVIAQSMYIFKQAKVGGVVVPHQDGAFLYTEPQSCLGFWWPLHDCTQDNGCLWAVPGSHKNGVPRRFRRQAPPNEGTEFVPLEPIEWDTSNAVPLVIPKGSLVVLHNALVHYSKENNSENPRHAYSIHVIEGSDGYVYPSDNWLQRPADNPFREIVDRVM